MSQTIIELVNRTKINDENIKSMRTSAESSEGPDPGSELEKAFKELKITFSAKANPPGVYVMLPLQCIRYNAESEFAKSKGAAAQRDQWWSRVQFRHELDGKHIVSDVFPIEGAYLDLMPRTGTNGGDYSKSYTNCYIPNAVVTRLGETIQDKGKYTLVKGKEIVDMTQSLTSFTCNHASGGPCSVTMYRTNLDKNDKIKSVATMPTNTHDMYGSNLQKGGAILGGVGFFYVSANTSTPPETNVDALSPGHNVILKFKLISFHALGISTESVNVITYKRKAQTKTY